MNGVRLGLRALAFPNLKDQPAEALCPLRVLAVSKRSLERVRISSGSDARRLGGFAYALIAAISG